jgi:hypothetical protein
MKKIKYFLLLIILILLGILIYQNLDYFMTAKALKFDLKVFSWNWTIPEIQNIAFFALCFFIGLILTGFKWLMATFKFKKELKGQSATIESLKKQLQSLKEDLDVFQHDPYIKKEIEEKQKEAANEQNDKKELDSSEEQDNAKKGDKIDTTD